MNFSIIRTNDPIKLKIPLERNFFIYAKLLGVWDVVGTFFN
jgi:hypothetical protein